MSVGSTYILLYYGASLHEEAGVNTWCKSCTLDCIPSTMCVRHAWYKQNDVDDVQSCFICTVFCVTGKDVIFKALPWTVLLIGWFLAFWTFVLLQKEYSQNHIVKLCSQKTYHVAFIDFQNFFWRLSRCQVVLHTITESCLASKAAGCVLKLTSSGAGLWTNVWKPPE